MKPPEQKKPLALNQFDDERIKRIAAMAEEIKADVQKNWTAESVFARLDEAIIGNERYKKSLAISIADFVSEAQIRNHLLVVGPSGTGKTYLLEKCLPDFDLPYHIVDGSSLVPSGYKGNTLQESLSTFFSTNIVASKRCIIVMDEFERRAIIRRNSVKVV